MDGTVRKQSPGATLTYYGVLILGAVSFLAAVVTGIWRIALTRGFLLPPIPEWWPPHGHLMVGGFLAALILFERMIGLQIRALIWVPYAYAGSAILLHTGWLTFRFIHFVALAGWFFHRWFAYKKFHQAGKPLVESAAFATLSCALNYPGGLLAKPEVALAALAFPIATIAVERLEMSLHFRRTRARLVLAGLILWCGLWISSAWLGFPNVQWMGIVTLVVLSGTAYCDVALQTLQHHNVGEGRLHSFLRTALKVAYCWAFFASLSMILWNRIPGAVAKDLVFHLAGLGFIFSMILAHAPIILASALGKQPPVIPAWLPFVVFQAMTVIRIIGDLSVTMSVSIWSWTGWITGIGHLISFLVYVVATLRSLRG